MRIYLTRHIALSGNPLAFSGPFIGLLLPAEADSSPILENDPTIIEKAVLACDALAVLNRQGGVTRPPP